MPEAETPEGFLSFILNILDKHGVVALVLCFVCLLFWRMVWKVWDRAMNEKNAEIERLVKERDKYQSLVFERMLSSQNPPAPAATPSEKS